MLEPAIGRGPGRDFPTIWLAWIYSEHPFQPCPARPTSFTKEHFGADRLQVKHALDSATTTAKLAIDRVIPSVEAPLGAGHLGVSSRNASRIFSSGREACRRSCRRSGGLNHIALLHEAPRLPWGWLSSQQPRQ